MEKSGPVFVLFAQRDLQRAAKEKPIIISVYVGNTTPKAIAVRRTSIAAFCHPQAEPIEMPEIY